MINIIKEGKRFIASCPDTKLCGCIFTYAKGDVVIADIPYTDKYGREKTKKGYRVICPHCAGLINIDNLEEYNAEHSTDNNNIGE